MLDNLLSDSGNTAWLSQLGPELVYLFPRLQERAEFNHAPQLTDIAVPPSRRRLHKESEQIFRVTQAIVRIILCWADRYAPHGLHIHFDDLHHMDEQTLRVFMRLGKCLWRAPQVTLSANGAMHTHTAMKETDAILPTCFLHRPAMRGALLQKIFEHTAALDDSALVQVPATHDANLTLTQYGQTQEAERTQHFLQTLKNEDAVATGVALLVALEASVFTQNYDHAQWLVEQSLPVFTQFNREQQREVLIHLGLIHAFTVDFPLAFEAMEASFSYADSTREKAESRFFSGLLLIKRMDRIPEGRAKLMEALNYIAEMETPEAYCERAWIYNVMALSYVGEKNMNEARKACQNALSNLKLAQRSPDATHIKINVISNMTVLDEYAKTLDVALTRWSFFEPYLDKAGPVFSKHYLFRKGGLLVKAGRFDEAVQALEACYRLSEQTHDVFYGDVIANGIAGIYSRQGQHASAAKWYRTSLDAKDALMDDNHSQVLAALAISLAKAGKMTEAAELIASMRGDASVPSLENNDWLAPLPATKLNRPFDFTNLY